jgi:hypothetical protein
MVLRAENISKLQKLGLNISFDKNCMTLCLPQEKDNKKCHLYYLENPIIEIKKENFSIEITHWNFFPGPGPGDFKLNFENEEEAIHFIKSYYFGENVYRETLKTYVLNNRKSYNSKELKLILEELINLVNTSFDNDEILLNERGTYNKISSENWNIVEANPEHFEITVGWGYLHHELGQLRDKISNKLDFNSEDVAKISSLLMDLSINLKKRNCS